MTADICVSNCDLFGISWLDVDGVKFFAAFFLLTVLYAWMREL